MMPNLHSSIERSQVRRVNGWTEEEGGGLYTITKDNFAEFVNTATAMVFFGLSLHISLIVVMLSMQGVGAAVG